MKKILIMGDSNTWGYISGTMNWSRFTYDQYPHNKRWTGVLARELGKGYVITEDAMPGRTIAEQCDSVKSKLFIDESWDITIIMLGTNDLQTVYQLSTEQITAQMDALCASISTESVLLIAPLVIMRDNLSKEWLPSFEGRDIQADSTALTHALSKLATRCHYTFFDASYPPLSSQSDGLHFDEGAHAWLGFILSKLIKGNSDAD